MTPTAEGSVLSRNFHLHYAWRTASIDACASVLALLLQAALSVRNFYGSTHVATQGEFVWMRAALVSSSLALLYILGRQRYTNSIGLNSVWQRLIFATGIVFNMRPGNCSYCGSMWNHRLLFVHLALLVRRVPAAWYWSGGVISWLAAAAVDAVDSKSVADLLVVLQDKMTDTPIKLLQDTLTATRASMFVWDIALPGVLLTWLEWRAYGAWLQQQQHSQLTALLSPPQHESQQSLAAGEHSSKAIPTPFKAHMPLQADRQLEDVQPSSHNSSSSSLSGLAGTDFDVYGASDLSLTPTQLIFGFQDHTAEAAYNSFKSAALQQQDMFSVGVYIFLSVVCCTKFVLVIASGTPGTVGVIVAGLRMMFTLMFAMLHTLLWMSGWHSRLRSAQQWRGTMTWGIVLIGQVVSLVCLMSGGNLGTATRIMVDEYFASPLVLIAYRHVVQPLQFCAGIAPATILYLEFQALFYDTVFGRPQLKGLGPIGTAVFYLALHLAVAISVEARLRRRFVNSRTSC